MREASDELCREHGLSVVESPGRGGARHHAEWRAEREGRPTWRSLVKADVDEAVGRAASMRQFHANLRAMGYDVKVGKDISVRPPGKERFVRLRRNFGDAYSQEGIGARILANSRQRLPLGRPRPAPKERPPVPKGTLVSLYRRYMALLNGAKRRGRQRAGAFPAARGSARTRSHIGGARAARARGDRDAIPAGGIRKSLGRQVRGAAGRTPRAAQRGEALQGGGIPRAPKPPHRRDSVGAAGRKARGARLRAHPGKKRRAARPASRRSRAPKRTERKGRWKVMDASSEAAEQIVRMTLEGTEVALRITGAGAKNAAAMLLAAAASNEKTKGRARLSAMLKSGRELRVFPIRFDDLKGFAKEARRYGIAYAVVKQKDGESVDLLVRAEDASKVNRIAERLGLCRMRDDAREAPEPREGNRHDGRAHAAQAPRAPEQAAALLDDLLASPGDSDASPLAQAPAESRPSGPTSARKRLSEKDGEAARKRCGRLSVRAEMRAISAAREMSGEAHATRKPMARALEKGR